LGIAFLAGLISFLSPCVLPLVPVYLAYLTGATYQDLSRSGPSWKTTLHASAFILGFSLVFTAFGASATLLGGLLLSHRAWIERAGGAVLLVFGLWMTGILPIGFLYRDIRVHLTDKPSGYLGSVLVGAAFAAGWTPCVGPVLASILILASRSASVAHGVLLLASYSLGIAVPLFACSLILERAFKWIKKASPVLPVVEKVTGVCLSLMGVMLALGWFSRISSLALSRFSGWAAVFGKLGL